MMKKAGAFLCCCTLIALLSACSDSDEKEQVIEASIDQASYVLSGKNDSNHDQEGSELMQVDLQVKNISDSAVQIVPSTDVQLYDGDSQREPNDVVHDRVGLKSTNGVDLAADKQTDMTVLFDVKKDEAYEINISSLSTDENIETADVQVDLDTSDYAESYEELEDPGKALKAYIEQLYFDKDNSDYKALVSADKDKIQESARNQFEKGMDVSIVEEGVSEHKMDQLYESFKETSADKAKIEPEVEAKTNNQALVDIDYDAIDLGDISDEIDAYKEKYNDKHDNYDAKKEEKYALSKFEDILDDLETKSSVGDFEIKMKKKDGKWQIDEAEAATDRLNRAFAKGSVL